MAAVNPNPLARHNRVLQFADTFDLALDQDLLASLPTTDLGPRPLQVYLPSIKQYSSTELPAIPAQRWPAVSLTGPNCELNCEHCQAKVLESMQAATDPDSLWRIASSAALTGARGMLISGGSNRRNELPLAQVLPVLARIKSRFPDFLISCHTGFVDKRIARGLREAGVDCVMLDIIAALDTLRQVYHLKQLSRVEGSLALLLEQGLRVVPHIVAGLHFGRLLGEWAGLELVQAYRPAALVLVVAMPHFASNKHRFEIPDPHQVGRLFRDARAMLPQLPIILGCARPPGKTKAVLDIYALCSGLDGIAYPSEQLVSLARTMGKEVIVHDSCCAVTAEVLIQK